MLWWNEGWSYENLGDGLFFYAFKCKLNNFMYICIVDVRATVLGNSVLTS